MNNSPIVIAGRNVKDYLLSVIKRGQSENEVVLHYSDKYIGTTEHLLRLLRSSGWEEKERGDTETMNLRCKYDETEIKECKTCGNKKIIKKCTHADLDMPRGCEESLRTNCKYYKKKYNNTIRVNYVVIEKLPQLR